MNLFQTIIYIFSRFFLLQIFNTYSRLSEISKNLPGKLKLISVNLPALYSRVYGTYIWNQQNELYISVGLGHDWSKILTMVSVVK